MESKRQGGEDDDTGTLFHVDGKHQQTC